MEYEIKLIVVINLNSNPLPFLNSLSKGNKRRIPKESIEKEKTLLNKFISVQLNIILLNINTNKPN
jgi:hypothetical protein